MITAAPLTTEAFAPYGDVIELSGDPTVIINQGNCARYSDLARMDPADGRLGISLFHAKPYSFPLELPMMERHPLGSQAFLPIDCAKYLVVVAFDGGGFPENPHAFLATNKQGVNYLRNTWHAVLTPLDRKATFAVVDRIGAGNNLQEHWFDSPIQIA